MMSYIQERINIGFCSLDIIMTHDEVLLGIFFVGGKCRTRHLGVYDGTSSVYDKRTSSSLYAKELLEYINGKRTVFSVAETLDFQIIDCGTPFQYAVWNALLQIPYGSTCTYKEIAMRIGYKNGIASRAVGNAVGANPFGIIVPCHRVVPVQGGEGHFSGGDYIKRHLLALEHDVFERTNKHTVSQPI